MCSGYGLRTTVGRSYRMDEDEAEANAVFLMNSERGTGGLLYLLS